MDNTKQSPTVLSLCTGYGGIERGIERAIGEVRVLAHVEIEAFAIANLVAKMEQGNLVPAPIWTNLKTLPTRSFRKKVDILTGGYPCQPFSAAGKRLGTEDPRHLFPHILRIIDEVMPRMCFFENVEGHVSLGLREVLQSLEERGYKTSWGIFSAQEVGADHQRKRVFILANSGSIGLEKSADDRQVRKEGHSIICNNVLPGLSVWDAVAPSRTSFCGMDDGVANRVDRLRLLGNGVVPQTAEIAFRTLLGR